MKSNISNTKYFLICFTLIFLYLQGAINEYVVPDKSYIEAAKLALFSLMALTFLVRRPAPGFLVMLLFLGWNFLSMLYNEYTLSDWYLHSRFLLNSYIFMNFVWHARLSSQRVNNVLKLILSLFVLQVVAAAFELFVLDEKTEFRVGTMFFGSGGYATIFPLVAISYGLGVFYFYKRNWKSLLLTFSFFLVGYASGKRAIFFFVPFLFLVAEVVYLRIVKSPRKILKNTLLVTALVIPLTMIIFSTLGTTKRFTSLGDQSGIASKIEFIIDVAIEYDFRETESGRFGRGANNVHMLGLLQKGEYTDIWLGLGPRSATKEKNFIAYKKYDLGYGVPGWIFNLVNTGVPAAVVVLLIFIQPLRRQLRVCKFNQLNGLGQALYFGNILFVVSFLINYFWYSNAFTITSLFTIIYFLMITFLISPSYKGMFVAPPRVPDHKGVYLSG